MTLEEFNVLDRDSARNALRPCVDIDRWIDAVVDARPYFNLEDVLRVAREGALPWTEAELDGALVHHPRIGEMTCGASAEASLSRSEQAGVDPKDTVVTDALFDGNRAYEGKFGRVFLIRAAGRSAAEMLTSLQNRMLKSPEEEVSVAAQQLREIALLRLEGILVP
ncbi:2-oxo-4-hydroxy-4-carboxy-5-ureidoimidazoline decarboxylase [Cryobacterium sp. Y11]|jgi:2-oxo-4-hydroxy-4-carboxy-5-ureidoimidazoline decarboxylase|uniref:2-oxo-4-hydroxy-4-carboxy-5-ureidoimidazoline decarboxylase n=1 Tax=Cryobacterium sp. Y11 TaxID=2045016 RepID=UPI000CE45DA8|nr:2-oxo-4-hydroxy-4-carboxy-5-ureidoimidazoline decarboxylase [Cryobacterium sp. Y11]